MLSSLYFAYKFFYYTCKFFIELIDNLDSFLDGGSNFIFLIFALRRIFTSIKFSFLFLSLSWDCTRMSKFTDDYGSLYFA